MTDILTPLEVCQRLIGPIEEISCIAGYKPKAAYNWRHPSADRDAGDIPSARLMRRLLDYSDEHGLGVTADHLIMGADADEIDAILAARAAGRVAAQ